MSERDPYEGHPWRLVRLYDGELVDITAALDNMADTIRSKAHANDVRLLADRLRAESKIAHDQLRPGETNAERKARMGPDPFWPSVVAYREACETWGLLMNQHEAIDTEAAQIEGSEAALRLEAHEHRVGTVAAERDRLAKLIAFLVTESLALPPDSINLGAPMG